MERDRRSGYPRGLRFSGTLALLAALAGACGTDTSQGARRQNGKAAAERRSRSTARPPSGGPTVGAEIEETRVLPVEADSPVEPSGLALLGGELLSVSDEDDDVIFRMVLGESSALMEPWLALEVPEPRPPELDLEGIATCEGRIFVLSEAANDVMEVDLSGKARWIGGRARFGAMAHGLLGAPGAGLEGLACDDGGLVLASEREPRALVWLPFEAARPIRVQVLDLEDVVGREFSSDFSDLASARGRLWALYRYTYEILEVLGEPGSVTLLPHAELSRVALDPRHRYARTRFGTAEGLAVDDGYFYVVADNNDLPRAAAPADSRPLLFVIPRS